MVLLTLLPGRVPCSIREAENFVGFHPRLCAASSTPGLRFVPYPHTPFARTNAMEQPKQAKEKVREYMERRQIERRQNARSPLHEPDQIRHEIGWDLVERRQEDRRGK